MTLNDLESAAIMNVFKIILSIPLTEVPKHQFRIIQFKSRKTGMLRSAIRPLFFLKISYLIADWITPKLYPRAPIPRVLQKNPQKNSQKFDQNSSPI